MLTHYLKAKLVLPSFLFIYILVAIIILKNYFLWDFNVGIALVLAPYICSVQKGKFSFRYLLPAIIIAILALVVPVKTLLFLAIIFALLFFLENFSGKLNNVILFLLILVSPIFKFFSSAVGFPIRLWLSKAATNTLTILGFTCTANGNIIHINNFEFSVDQACAGLNMLATSLIICLFIIAFYQKNQSKNLSFLQCVGLILLTVGLNIVSNLLRIVLLILFKIMPENLFHSVVGILCLLVYVVIPLLYIIKYIIKKYGITVNTTIKKTVSYNLRLPILHIVILLIIVVAAYNIENTKKTNIGIDNIKLKGCKQIILENGITKIKTPQTLIYLKTIQFYAPEHNPMICWKGSGYNFKSIKTETIAGKEIYTSVLTKGNDKIYSAWWFESKNTQTINQFLWRWEAFKNNDQFYLININAANYLTLLTTTEKIIHRDYSL
ncbi:MAG: exosortase N [Sphingobacteriales bacterium]|nr:MAG: exosortase N [Sphingobacteriales bacterium]